MMKGATFRPKLRLLTRMPALEAKPEIDTETENYKQLDSYASYGLRDLKIPFQPFFFFLTFL